MAKGLNCTGGAAVIFPSNHVIRYCPDCSSMRILVAIEIYAANLNAAFVQRKSTNNHILESGLWLWAAEIAE